MTVYVDLDGVLADFDLSAGRLLGTDNVYKYEFVHGRDEYWDRLNKDPNFFTLMEEKEDAFLLWEAICHLSPVILTALPRINGEHVEAQKREWVRRHRGPHVEVIACRTKDKPNYCKPLDVMIDDRATNKYAWLNKGGHYITHTSAARTIRQLRALGIISAPRTNG